MSGKRGKRQPIFLKADSNHHLYNIPSFPNRELGWEPGGGKGGYGPRITYEERDNTCMMMTVCPGTEGAQRDIKCNLYGSLEIIALISELTKKE